MTTFEQLSIDYPSTLSCPCSQISIPYNRFLAFNPEYHQVCSSDFVRNEWISSLFNVTMTNNYLLDFRLIASSQFQVLALLCRTANATVVDAIKEFTSSEMISRSALFRANFDIQIAALVEQLQTTTRADNSRIEQLFSLVLAQNRLFSALRTNFYVANIPGSNGFATYSASYANIFNEINIISTSNYPNDACSCSDTFDCKFPSGIFNWSGPGSMIAGDTLWSYPPPLFFVSGMQAGCIPQTSLLSSTLECFFNQTCLNLVTSSTDALVGVTPLNFTIGYSSFNPNTLVSNIFDQLMIESWHNTTDFGSYFEVCSPTVCTYSYSQRFNVVYMITTLVSLTGGLCVAMHILSSFIIKFLIKRKRSTVTEEADEADEANVGIDQNKITGATNAVPRSQKINGSWSLRYQSKVYSDGNNSCSCGSSSSCTKPQGFYCNSPMCHYGTSLPNLTISGFKIGCCPIDSILLSTLECLFNQSCIQMLIDWRLFGFTQDYLSINLTNINALNSSIQSQYLSNTSLETIILQLFVENWTETVDYAAHYSQCQPKSCTYTFIEQRRPIFIITNVVGLLGGLTVILRLLVPPCVKTIRHIYHHRYNRSERKIGKESNNFNIENNEFAIAGIHTHWSFSSLIASTRQSLLTINVYETESASNNQLLASRIYLVLVIISITIISLFIGLSQQTHSFTVDSPTETQFEYLHSQYPATLTCPCSQIVIQYNKFLNVSPVMHQACSSPFVSSGWSTSLFSMGSTWTVPDWFLLSIQFRLLSSLCDLAKDVAYQSGFDFISNELANVETLPVTLFQAQVSSAIALLTEQTPARFRRTLAFIIDACQSNQLQDQFMSSWKMIYSNSNESYVFRTVPLSYNNNTCTCAVGMLTCSRSLSFWNSSNNTITFPGFNGGCLPIFGLRVSTFECLYDQTCVNKLTALIGFLTPIIVLNSSDNTRYPPNATLIGSIMDDLFIETWSNSSNYSSYFYECAPASCQYSYVERNDIVYMLTILLALYGGLTISIRLIVWYGLDAFVWLLTRCRRSGQVIPVIVTE
ncbi:unnamed protein product [Rotaria sp. Silwood2]|nr:unnamed protein product [Rotaria sp. Silwood2]CAF2930230.1 unnamed protein product [Rotaria sp. Silwood2]CAF3289552.1 unnamed protein product [Rotaria sp. Silwood2]CAF4038128.1 unnamed protein product [Rotaria sp. Silwood2]